MKNLLQSLFIITLFTLFSCSKESDTSIPDSNYLTGTYHVSVIENVVWGNSSGIINDTGILYITANGTNVSTSGYFSTNGKIVGNTIYFEPLYSQDNAGYTTTTFGPATFQGNVLRFQAVQVGKLKDNGILFPFRNNSEFTCIKQ